MWAPHFFFAGTAYSRYQKTDKKSIILAKPKFCVNFLLKDLILMDVTKIHDSIIF